MNEVKRYFVRLIAAAAFSGILVAWIPGGAAKKAVRLVTGLLIVLTALAPITRLSFEDVRELVGRTLFSEEAGSTPILTDSREAVAGIIKEKTETYILDRGRELGMQLTAAEAEVSESGGYPVPASVLITGRYTASQRESLSRWITEQLAIPKDAQEWKWE